MYIETESSGLNFYTLKLSPLDSISFRPSTCLADRTQKTFKTTLTISLIPSRFVLSFPLTPSLTLIPFCSVSHSHSLSLRRHHPSAPLLSQQSLPSSNDFPTTAGYHSHLISSMRFLGFISLYE